MPAKLQRLAALLWLVAILLLTLSAWYSWQDTPPLETSVHNLLPTTQHSPLQKHALQQLTYRGERQVIFLVGDSDKKRARAAATQFYQQLNKPELFDTFQLRVDEQLPPWQDFFFAHRYHYLTRPASSS